MEQHDEQARAAFRRLRALKVGTDAGWFDYVAGDLRAGVHLVRVNGRPRELRRDFVYWVGKRKRRVDEVPWWVLGVADAKGSGEVIDALAQEPAPELVTVDEAARILGLSVEGVVNRIGTGKLYPVYLGYGDRRLLRVQVEGDVDATRTILAGLPPAHRLTDLHDYTGPPQSPFPLPIPTSQPETTRRIQALMIGDQHEWFAYLSADTDRDAYTVQVDSPAFRGLGASQPGEPPVQRVLPGEGVLPWVLGVADVGDDHDLIAYRDGLG